ncbi:hypothetical protein ES703_88837 [subsurface metagenome]
MKDNKLFSTLRIVGWLITIIGLLCFLFLYFLKFIGFL